jgi:hypothetical protein
MLWMPVLLSKEQSGLHVILKILVMRKSQHAAIQPVVLIIYHGVSYVKAV